MDDGKEITLQFYHHLSTREKKIMTELFGPAYPNEDLASKSVVKIISKIRPSAAEKLKALALMSYLKNYYVLTETERINIHEDGLTEEERAMRLLDALLYKGSYGIGCLYVTLMDSSNESFGPPTHYQLACELKRNIHQEWNDAALSLSGIVTDHQEPEQKLESYVGKFKEVTVTQTQAESLCDYLGIDPREIVSDTTNLTTICRKWIVKKGVWSQIEDLVEALVLTKDLGRHVALIEARSYQNLKVFLEGLHHQWILIVRYLGFKESEIDPVITSHDTVGEQIDEFMKIWSMPDCGQKTGVILQKLKRVAGIQDTVPKPHNRKPTSLTQPTLLLDSYGAQSALSTKDLPSHSPTTANQLTHRPVSSQGYTSLKLNIISSSFLSEPRIPTYKHVDTNTHSQVVKKLDAFDDAFQEEENTNLSSDSEKKEKSVKEKTKNAKETKQPVNTKEQTTVSELSSVQKKTEIFNTESSSEIDSYEKPIDSVSKDDATSVTLEPRTEQSLLYQVSPKLTSTKSQMSRSLSSQRLAIKFPNKTTFNVLSPQLKHNDECEVEENSEEVVDDSEQSTSHITPFRSNPLLPESYPQDSIVVTHTKPIAPNSFDTDVMENLNAKSMSTEIPEEPSHSLGEEVSSSTTSTVSTPESDSSINCDPQNDLNTSLTSTSTLSLQPSKGQTLNQLDATSGLIPDTKSMSSDSGCVTTSNIQSSTEDSGIYSSTSGNVTSTLLKVDDKERCDHDLVKALLDEESSEVFDALLDSMQDTVSTEVNKPLPDEFSTTGDYPLHVAVNQNAIAKVRRLISVGANIDQKRLVDYCTPLHLACHNGGTEMIKTLVEEFHAKVNLKDKNGDHCLHKIKTLQLLSNVSILLQNGSAHDPPNSLFYTPLVLACQIGDTVYNTAEELLQYRASVEGLPKCHTSPLLLASEGGHKAIVTLLLSKGANINRQDSKSGETPLIKACLGEHVDVVKILLEEQAELEITDAEKRTALTAAVVKGSDEIVELLLERNIPANIHYTRPCPDSNGRMFNITPLCDAFARGYLSIAKILIAHGADLNTTNSANEDVGMNFPDKDKGIIPPLVFACMMNQIEIVKYVTSLPQFDMRLPFTAEPTIEAIKRGYTECAKVLYERYGGLEKMMEDANTSKYFELCRRLSFQKRHSQPSSQTKTDNTLDSTDGLLNEPVNDVVDQQNTSIPHKLSSAIQSNSDTDKLVSEDSSKKVPCSVTHTSLLQAKLLSSSPTDATKDVSTESYESESKINLSSHSSNESLTYIHVSDDNDNNIAPEEIEHSLSTENSTITSEPLNPLDAACDNPVNPLDMDNSPVTDSLIDISFPALTSSASFFNPPKTSAPVNGLTKPVDMIQEDGDTTECMSDDNPFKPVDKVPVQHDDAVFSDSQHVQLGAGSLRSFHGSAIEVLYDFTQYLISACLQTHTPDVIIMKAENIGETELVHFFTKYFYDPSIIASGNSVVADFIKGFPSPLNFLIAAKFCSRHHFETILKEVGREDFADQLMLALHQFPDSDSIPWSGSGLLNALFSQTFSIGTPFHSSAIEIRKKPSHHETTSDNETHTFPRTEGHRLGYRDEPVKSDPPSTMKPDKHTDSMDDTSDQGERDVMNDLDTPDEATVHLSSTHRSVRNIPARIPESHDINNVTGFSRSTESVPVSIHTPDELKSQTMTTTSSTPTCTTSTVDTVQHIPVPTNGTASPIGISTTTTTTSLPPISTPFLSISTSSDSDNPLRSDTHKTFSSLKTTDEQISVHDDTSDSDISDHKLKPPVTQHHQMKTGAPLRSKNDIQKRIHTGAHVNGIPPSPKTPVSRTKTEDSKKMQPPSQSRVLQKQTTKPSSKPETSPRLKPRPLKNTSVSVVKSCALSTSKGRGISRGLTTVKTHSSSLSRGSSTTKQGSLLLKTSPGYGSSSVSPKSKSQAMKKKQDELQTPSLTNKKDQKTYSSCSDSTVILSKTGSDGENKVKRKQTSDSQVQKGDYQGDTTPSVIKHIPTTYSTPPGATCQLLRNAGSQEAFPAKQIHDTKKIFRALSHKLYNWKMLGRYLLLSDSHLLEISTAYTSNEQAYQMLMKWKHVVTPPDVNYAVLANALHSCMRDDLLCELREHLKYSEAGSHLQNERNPNEFDISITVPLSEFWENLRPFIESRMSTGYSNVNVSLKFQ